MGDPIQSAIDRQIALRPKCPYCGKERAMFKVSPEEKSEHYECSFCHKKAWEAKDLKAQEEKQQGVELKSIAALALLEVENDEPVALTELHNVTKVLKTGFDAMYQQMRADNAVMQDRVRYLTEELNASHAAEIETQKAKVEAEKAMLAQSKAPLIWHYCRGKNRDVRPWSVLLCSCCRDGKEEDNFSPLEEFKKVDESRAAGWECLDMVKDALVACGTDMSATPPMFYEEAVKATVGGLGMEKLRLDGIRQQLDNAPLGQNWPTFINGLIDIVDGSSDNELVDAAKKNGKSFVQSTEAFEQLMRIQKRLAAIPHGRPGTGLVEMLKIK